MIYRQIFNEVFTVESIIAGFVFVTVLGAVLLAVVTRRARPGVAPSPHTDRHRLEKYYVGALTVVAVGLVVYTAWANHRQHRGADEPVARAGQAAERAVGQADQSPVRVEVTGFQWCWSFAYPETAGRSEEPVTVRTTCRDGKVPTLVVPTGRPVRLELTSEDVIHSFWIPELRYKRDAFPHHTNTFSLTFDREGEWEGRCAEFCGNRHYAMDFRVRAVSPEEYNDWLADQAATGQGTGGTGGAAA